VVCDYRASRGSSVSIVSDYGLDDRPIEVRSPAGAKDFSSNLCVQIGSEAHPASCTMGTGVLSPGVKRGRGVTLTAHPHLMPRSRMSWSYTSSAPKRKHGVWRTALLCFGSTATFTKPCLCLDVVCDNTVSWVAQSV
jgi:hypothetical protein